MFLQGTKKFDLGEPLLSVHLFDVLDFHRVVAFFCCPDCPDYFVSVSLLLVWIRVEHPVALPLDKRNHEWCVIGMKRDGFGGEIAVEGFRDGSDLLSSVIVCGRLLVQPPRAHEGCTSHR